MKKLTILIIVLVAFITTSFNPVTDAINYNVEESIEVEDWMTEPFIDSVEQPLVLEDWMTKPFNINS